MKHANVWILSVLLALLCVGTALALFASHGWKQAEPTVPEQSETQPAQSGVESDPAESEAPASGTPEEGSDTQDETLTDGAVPENNAPAPVESATHTPGGSAAPAPGGTHTSPAPGQSAAPNPHGSAAPAPTGTGASASPVPGTQTPPPSGSAAPATQSPVSPAPSASAAPGETAAPTVSLPTMPALPVETGTSEEAKRINELYAELSALRSEAIAQLAALADQAEAEWLAIRDKHPSRKKFITKYYEQGTELEASYDAQMDALCNELQYLLTKTGGDVAVVRQIRAEYEAEKESARAAYYQRFMTLLDLA